MIRTAARIASDDQPLAIPDSNARLLGDGDLAGLDCDQLWIARNEFMHAMGISFRPRRERPMPLPSAKLIKERRRIRIACGLG
jgi:hypothetical protein